MHAFQDDKGHAWELALNVGSIKRVRGLLPDVDLMKPEAGDPPLSKRLTDDVVLVCDVIYCVVKPQADAKGITDEEFGARLGGEALGRAVDAFWEELADFFQGLDRSMSAAVEKHKTKEALPSTPGKSSTASPALSVAIPPP